MWTSGIWRRVAGAAASSSRNLTRAVMRLVVRGVPRATDEVVALSKRLRAYASAGEA